MEKKKLSRIVCIGCLLFAATLLTGCAKQKPEIKSLADLKNEAYTIGMASDIYMQEPVLELCPNAEIVYIEGNNYIQALQSGKIDGYVIGEMSAAPAVEKYGAEGFVLLDEPIKSYDIALGLYVDTPVTDYLERVNECIRRYKEDGTLEEMKARWSSASPVKAEIKAAEDPEYTIKAVTYGAIKPYTYYQDGALTGLDIELAERIAADLGCGIEWEVAEFSAMLAGLATGKYDLIASNLYKTEERDTFLFSEPYLADNICLVTVHTPTETEFNTLEDLKTAKTFSSVTGSIISDVIRKYYPQAEVKEYNTLMDAVLAVQNGKADATMYDEPVIAHIAVENPDLKMIPEKLTEESYHYPTAQSEEGIVLAEDINVWLAEAKESGLIDELADFWIGSESPEGHCDFSALTGENGKLVIGTDITSRPDSFMYNGKPVGMSLDILYHYCKDRELKAETQILDIGAFPAALSTGKIDVFAAFVSYTEERAENMTFTDSFYDGGISVLVRETEDSGIRSFFKDLAESFEKTFIREDRWKLILSGLGETLLISIGSFILANLLGALFCWFNMSGSKSLQTLANIYSRIMQGTPIVVVLMILYYVILGKTKLSGTVVSIIGFGLVTGSGLAQIFEEAIRGVNRGQKEAALALGFSKAETFRGIVFPQAVRTMLPGYFTEFIALLKSTSIVGYIAVVDLTKASDIIRGSTYEAFFPLISIAIIYFVIINILLSIMKAIRRSLAPKRATRKEAAK